MKLIKIPLNTNTYDIKGITVADYPIDGVLTRLKVIGTDDSHMYCDRWETRKKTTKAIGLVRNKDGYVTLSNTFIDSHGDLMPSIAEIVGKDGFITAESYPDTDKRIEKWR